jgi:hypothetical protein
MPVNLFIFPETGAVLPPETFNVLDQCHVSDVKADRRNHYRAYQ